MARIDDSHSTAVAIASSHSISRNSPEPRSPTRAQRLLELGRRGLLHDAGGALAADHAAVDRVIAVALDVADAAVLEMHFDPAAAGAHVTGRTLHFVGDPGRSIDQLAGREIVAQPAGERHASPRDPTGGCVFIRVSSTRPLLRGSRACRAHRFDRSATRPRDRSASPPGAAVW